MSSPNKWLAVHFSDGLDGTRWELEIVPLFERAYIEADKPKGMALFSFTPIGGSALYMTPESVPHCSSVLALIAWSESNPLPRGPSGWLAGDESLKPV
jgi:hypothetical protein